ncbi:MFS transporter [Arcanobacterium ihumii]|uniref:MFS transporter n=1 Tax=Arcanobacterium ihumii TaxID=2138162 RepID=UPI000F5401EF|nr:MFS transporter [Arcanobacterium ihumii]
MTLLLAVLYAAFISLGLPDAAIGAAWPFIAPNLGADPAGAGIITMIVCIGTISSSFASVHLLEKLSTVKVSIISVALTAITLLGYAFSPSFLWLCILALPLGLGAGAIDAAINAFVSINYSTRHNNWLHACWGVGASFGPLIVGWWLESRGEWRPAYITLATLQFLLLVLLVFSRSLWTQAPSSSHLSDSDDADAPRLPWHKLPHIWPILLGFFLYCAIELSAGLWGATFLVDHHSISPGLAAMGASGFYLGITGGRFIAGIAAERMTNIQLLRTGSAIMLLGGATTLISPSALIAVTGFVLIGFGCAPIYPVILKETPRRLGVANTQRAMGLQMGFAYTGQLLMPPIVGLLMTRIDSVVMPVFALTSTVIMIACHELVEIKVSERTTEQG